MLSQCYLDEWIWNVGCIQHLVGFSTSFRWKILWKKYSFQLIFCFIESLARSACLKVRHVNSIEEHFKQNVYWWVLIQVWTSSELFSKIYWQYLSNDSFPRDLSTLPKTFHPVAQKLNSNYASWRPLECLEKHFSAFLGKLGRRKASWLGVLFRCRAFSGRAEWSLFWLGHVKMISFFPSRDFSLRFISVSVVFPVPVGRLNHVFV